MVLPGGIDASQNLVVQQDGALLVEAGGQELNHVMPCVLVADGVENRSVEVQIVDDNLQRSSRREGHFFVAEIAHLERLRVDLMHGGAGVADGADLVCIELFPPVQRSGQRDPHRNHASVLGMGAAALGQIGHQPVVFFAKEELGFGLLAVRQMPAIQRVAHALDDDFPLLGRRENGLFNRQHSLLSFHYSILW